MESRQGGNLAVLTLAGMAAFVLAACGEEGQPPAQHQAASASIGPREIEVSVSSVTEDQLPQASVQLDAVRVQTDVVYSTVAGYRPLRLDFYAAESSSPKPLVVFIHGGGWTTGTKRTTANFSDFPRVLAGLSERGFAVASIEYRLSSEAPFPAAVLDAKAAVRFMRANSGRFGIDPSRIAVWGGSAGAHLAAMTALTCGDEMFEIGAASDSDESECVQAWVGWYGPYDIADMLQTAMHAAKAPELVMSAQAAAEAQGGLTFFGCSMHGCDHAFLEASSPTYFVDAGDPPALLVHGTADTQVPHRQSAELLRMLRESGVDAELILIDGVGHGWVGPDHAATEAASREAMNTTSDWLVRQLAIKDE